MADEKKVKILVTIAAVLVSLLVVIVVAEGHVK